MFSVFLSFSGGEDSTESLNYFFWDVTESCHGMILLIEYRYGVANIILLWF